MPDPDSPIVGISPQLKTRVEKQNDVLSRLIVETDNHEIKNVLRLYDPTMTEKQLPKALTKAKVAHLVATLQFLGSDKDDDDNKPDVLNKLIIRIQSLFPDPCHICKSEYTIRRTDTPLLECIRCSQGVHPRCLAAKLGVAEVDLEEMTCDDVLQKLNPYGLETLVYLCGTCYGDYDSGPRPTPIPSQRLSQVAATDTAAEDSEDGGRTTRHTAAANNTADPRRRTQTDEIHTDSETDEGSDTESEDEPPPRPRTTNTDNHPKSTPKHKKKEQKNQTKPICSFYRRGTCRYGISGKGCPRAHPKLCPKLMTSGDKAPRGCSKGGTCEKLHPKMCQSSLLHRECLDDSCTLYHVKGTRRSNSRPKEQSKPNRFQNREANNHRNADNSSKSFTADPMNSAPNAFLEALNSWTKQFMSTLDQKLLQGGQTQHLQHTYSNPQQTYNNPQQTYSNPQLVPAGPPQTILLPQAQILHQGPQGVLAPRQ